MAMPELAFQRKRESGSIELVKLFPELVVFRYVREGEAVYRRWGDVQSHQTGAMIARQRTG
jgi:hypothetical protein